MKLSKCIGVGALALGAVFGSLSAGATEGLEVMAVYYPHWHRYPKGDEWFSKKWDWSGGEWAFVRDPAVRFKGQINFVPFGGYYIGDDPKDVATEIALAHNAGIDVFLYDYYWYDGQKTQEEAIEKGFLGAVNRNKMKFALMWCYHERKNAWRKKFGEEPPHCMSLAHTPEEFLGFIDYSIAHYFNQPEYWHYKGGLFFSIYNFSYLWEKWGKDAAKVRAAFAEARRRVRTAGLGDLHLNGQGIRPNQAAAMAELGLDSTTDYGYNAYNAPNAFQRYRQGERLFAFSEVDGPMQAHWRDMSEKSPLPYIPVVPTGWDATLRCRKDQAFPWPGERPDYPYCMTFTNSTDAIFEKYLRDARDHALADPKQPGVVYINAWNEYTEGCWLLPDRRRGDLKLRALARVFGRRPTDEYVYTDTFRSWEKKPTNQQAKTMEAPAVENVKYGPHERQGLDVWFPTKTRPAAGGRKTPAVIVIHGGGWSAGDRIPGAAGWLARCRKAGIALVSVGYRFIQDGLDENIKPPVKACQDDVLAAIRCILAHADEWNLDVTRLGLTGGSAGACSSLFAAFQDDCAFGIRAVFAESPQTSMDPAEMRAWIPNSTYGAWAFGYGNFDQWLAHRAESLPWIERYSPAALLRACTAAKAPAVFYSCADLPPPGKIHPDPTHSPVFCAKFQEICGQKGVKCARGKGVDFIAELTKGWTK